MMNNAVRLAKRAGKREKTLVLMRAMNWLTI